MRAERQRIKLLEDGGADERDVIAARAKYRGTSHEYATFSKAMGLPQQRERVTVDGLGNIGVGKYKLPVDKSGKSGIIKPEDVSATGKNELAKKGFPNKQKLNNHWQNGRTHAEEYKPDGITTKEQYEKRGVELAESAVDGKNILGYKTKEGLICRYDVKKNDYVKADVNKGIKTLFKPNQGIDYYNIKEGEESAKD